MYSKYRLIIRYPDGSSSCPSLRQPNVYNGAYCSPSLYIQFAAESQAVLAPAAVPSYLSPVPVVQRLELDRHADSRFAWVDSKQLRQSPGSGAGSAGFVVSLGLARVMLPVLVRNLTRWG
jgi:hypothetical protein